MPLTVIERRGASGHRDRGTVISLGIEIAREDARVNPPARA